MRSPSRAIPKFAHLLLEASVMKKLLFDGPCIRPEGSPFSPIALMVRDFSRIKMRLLFFIFEPECSPFESRDSILPQPPPNPPPPPPHQKKTPTPLEKAWTALHIYEPSPMSRAFCPPLSDLISSSSLSGKRVFGPFSFEADNPVACIYI